LGIDKQSDLAMLKINAADLQAAEFANVRPKTGRCPSVGRSFQTARKPKRQSKQLGQNFTQEDRRKRSQLERKLQHLQKDKEKLTRGF
jgi:hypothetical protein